LIEVALGPNVDDLARDGVTLRFHGTLPKSSLDRRS
jgi:hypothetical protein